MTNKIEVLPTYGKWFVLGEVGGKRRRLLCKCSCGTEKVVDLGNLVTGKSKSCGSMVRGCKVSPTTTHGMTKSTEYRSWSHCKTRCYNEDFLDYRYYGAKGIKVCDRWLESFENFLEDMGKKPSPKHTLDRIDVNGDYEPSNCRWATKTEQAFNQNISSDNTSGRVGVYINEYGYTASISYQNSQYYLGYFHNFESAVKAREDAELLYYGYLKHGSYFDSKEYNQ